MNRCLALIFVAMPLGVWPASADVCIVPEVAHPTIQSAVDDVACTEVQLLEQTYAETLSVERSLVLLGEGANTVVEGKISAQGAGVSLVLSFLKVESSCLGGNLVARSGAQITTLGVEVRHSTTLACPDHLFSDDFETGDASSWSP